MTGMPRLIYMLFILLVVSLWGSCRKDFEYVPSNGNLKFSKDTVFLDTVFTNIGSSTYSLKVYNKTGEDLSIPSIRLGHGQNSHYRLNVDGAAGKDFSNVPIFAGDSLFIFIETTLDISGTNQNSFLYLDAILFDTGTNLQEVHLVTLVKDAIFLYPKTNLEGNKETLLLGIDADGKEIRVEGFNLTLDQLNFTNERAYVVYGYAAVPENAQLTIDSGARVYFHNNSGLWVRPNASIAVNGALSTDTLLLEKEVIFEGDRLEPAFGSVPGQWGAIWISSGSTNNQIDHLTIKNATVGLLVEGNGMYEEPTLTIKNSQLYNSASVNLWARTANIFAENLVLGSAGKVSLYCNLGGQYSFLHTTISNYWTNSFRGGPALKIDNWNRLHTGEEEQGNLVGAQFVNCIIVGNKQLELSLESDGTNSFNFNFTNCLIQFKDTPGYFAGNVLYDFGNPSFFDQVILNESVEFVNPSNDDFRLGPNSAAKGKAQLEAALQVPLDILGNYRTSLPDFGAYQTLSN